MNLNEFVYEFTVTKEFFNTYINPYEKLGKKIEMTTDPSATLTNILDHHFESEKDLTDFIEGFKETVSKHEINAKNLNGLLYYIFYVNHHQLEFIQQDYFNKITNDRAKTLIDIILMPFEEIKLEGTHFEVDLLMVEDENLPKEEQGYINDILLPVKKLKHFSQKQLRDLNSHNQLNLNYGDKEVVELSKAFQISLNPIARKSNTIKIDSGFNGELLHIAVELLIKNLAERAPTLLDNILNRGFDYEYLKNLKSSLTTNKTRVNSLIIRVTNMMLPFLSNECGLDKGKSDIISIGQSEFLFDFFAIIGVLFKKPSFADKLKDVKKRLTAVQQNPYMLNVKAYQKSYPTYRKLIQEAYSSHVTLNQPIT